MKDKTIILELSIPETEAILDCIYLMKRDIRVIKSAEFVRYNDIIDAVFLKAWEAIEKERKV